MLSISVLLMGIIWGLSYFGEINNLSHVFVNCGKRRVHSQIYSTGYWEKSNLYYQAEVIHGRSVTLANKSGR